jgi:hypothetical protein
MSKIAISVLISHPIEGFIYNLISGRGDTILGGGYPYRFHVFNTTDRTYINAVDSSVRYDGGYHDNNINTITSSRSIYNKFAY